MSSKSSSSIIDGTMASTSGPGSWTSTLRRRPTSDVTFTMGAPRGLSAILATPRSWPGHADTGSLGYLAKRGSVADRAHIVNAEPLLVVTPRAWAQVAHRPAGTATLLPAEQAQGDGERGRSPQREDAQRAR